MGAFFPDFRTEQTNKRETGFSIVSSCYFWPGKNKKGDHNSYYELSVKRDTLLGFISVHFWVEELLTQFSSLMHLSTWSLLLFLFIPEPLSSFGVNCLPSHSSLIIYVKGWIWVKGELGHGSHWFAAKSFLYCVNHKKVIFSSSKMESVWKILLVLSYITMFV